MKINFDPEAINFYELKSLDEAEALVTCYPSSSKAWICYMVYILKQGEITKARSIARRGLQSINFRHDQERLNIWLALLNLENHYGSNNTLNTVLQEALMYNDQEKIYNHMVDLFISTGKKDELDKLKHTMLKKFRHDKNVWLKFASYYFETGNQKRARDIVNRSLQSLPVKDHADILGKAAHLEYKHGDSERSLNLYENILTKYPKRKDLKSTYIHVLKQLGQYERAEALNQAII